MSAARGAETTPEAAPTNAVATRGSSLSFKSVFQPAWKAAAAKHGQEDEEVHGVQVVAWLMCSVSPRAAVGWRMLGAPGIVEQRATGATDCVEIVVLLPGLARDFWREMPSGNAPALLGRLA
jgi:hypothetical protein